MSMLLETFKESVKRRVPDFRAGDTIRLHERIREGGKERIQVFSGVVIARKHGSEPGATFTIRKVSQGIGVEKVYPLHSPLIQKIEVLRRGHVRRAKLYYLRHVSASRARKKLKQFTEAIAPEKVELEETPTTLET